MVEKANYPVVATVEIIARLKDSKVQTGKPRISDVMRDVCREDEEFQAHAASHYNGDTGSPDTPRQQRILLAAALRAHKIAEGRLDDRGISSILQGMDRWMAKNTGLIVYRGKLRALPTISLK